MWGAWPLAIVGSLGYIAGQLPVGTYLGPYLPDVAGSIVCFICILLLLKVWRPAQVLGYGGKPIAGRGEAAAHGLSGGDIVQAWMPIAVLVAVTVAWTGPWSKLPGIVLVHYAVTAASSISQGATIAAVFNWTPFVGGSAILASWIVASILMMMTGEPEVRPDRRDFRQDLAADVGRLAGGRVHLRPGLCL